jgi:16S rRNA (guanine1207-N2)-methyltransferase
MSRVANADKSSDALDALFLPFATAALTLPEDGRVKFLRARAGRWIHHWPRAKFSCEQSFKPYTDELARAGMPVIESSREPATKESRQALVLVLPPRQREESRALLARAVRAAAPGGVVVASAANNAGARSAEADLERLAGSIHSLSKHKCRVFWAALPDAAVDWALVDEWAALDTPQPIAEGRFVSRPGLFAWDRIDTASALLASQLPPTLSGRAADLGAGYGYLATELLRRCPQVSAVDLYEAEQRALEPARINLANAVRECAREVAIDYLWHDVATGLPRQYDVIVSNPPFHQGRTDQPELGQAFIVAAANALESGGRLWLVANRHLPYEAVLAARFSTVRSVIVQDGFKVIEAIK